MGGGGVVGDGWWEGKRGMVVGERRCGGEVQEEVEEVHEEMLTPGKCH